MFAKLDDYTLAKFDLSIPGTGPWTVRNMFVMTDQAISGTVVLDASGTLFKGTVSGSVYGANWKGSMIAGNGNLGLVLPAKKYLNVSASLVVTDMLREAGEALSPLSQLAAFDILLPHWHRAGWNLSRELTAIVAKMRTTWKVLPDGSVYVGVDSGTEFGTDYIELDKHPETGKISMVPTYLTIFPGMFLGGQKIVSVSHYLDETDFRSEVWVQQ